MRAVVEHAERNGAGGARAAQSEVYSHLAQYMEGCGVAPYKNRQQLKAKVAEALAELPPPEVPPAPAVLPAA